MRHQTIVLLSALLASTGVFAQSQPSASESPAKLTAAPATTASTAAPTMTSAETHKRLPFRTDARTSPFKFKDQHRRSGMADGPPPSANDKSAVMGTDRPWQSGRPPVDCTVTPHGDGC